MSAVAASGSGKVRLNFQLLTSPTTFKPTRMKFYYFYQEYQLFKEMRDTLEKIQFLPCLVFETYLKLLVLADFCEEISQEKEFVILAVFGPHEKVNCFFCQTICFTRASGHA